MGNNKKHGAVQASYLPKLVDSEPSLAEKYIGLRRHEFYNEKGFMVAVVANEKGEIRYKSPFVLYETIKEMEEKYGGNKAKT
jgi:hypothetical protein